MIGFRFCLVTLYATAVLAQVAVASKSDAWTASQGRSVKFPDLIESISGTQVLDWDASEAPLFRRVAHAVLLEVRERPLRIGRVNEVGNAVEPLVIAALEEAGFEAGRPVPPSGRKKSAGYPDLYARAGEAFFYLEIKTYSPKAEKSSQRTFYVSPSDDFKVSRDAYHVALAFSTDEIEEGVYSLSGFKLLDLHGLECRLKLEFNASNRDLYDPKAGLVVAED